MAYTQIQKIENPTPVANEEWGIRSVVDGYHLVVAADNTTFSNLYKRNIDGVWEQRSSSNYKFGQTMYGNYFTSNKSSSKQAQIFNKDTLSFTPIRDFDSSAVDTSITTSFGISSAITDDFVAFGDSEYDSNKGAVFIYERIGTDEWALDANFIRITPDLSSENDYFGSSITTNGVSIIVGAYGDNQSKGAVYIFQKDEDTGVWEQTQKIFASDGEANDRFGESVSVSGNYFVVGASLKDITDGDANAGAAYVFKHTNDWYEIDKLVGVDESSYEGNNFGESVYINEDHIIIGSPSARSNKGVADIFYKKRSWGHLKKLTRDGTSLNDDELFGSSVSISGRFAVVGAPSYNSASTGGAIYVYEDPLVLLRLAQEFDVNQEYLPSKASVYLKRAGKNISDFWSIDNTKKNVIDATNFSTIDQATTNRTASLNINNNGRLNPTGTSLAPYFGSEVALSGDTMVVGARLDDNSGTEQGSAYVFYKDNNEWIQLQKLVSDDIADDDAFGNSVAIYGNYIVVGAYFKSGLDNFEGSVYVFYRDSNNPSDSWSQLQKLTASDTRENNLFGAKVAIEGNYIAIAGGGNTYIYYNDFNNPSNEWTEIQILEEGGSSVDFDGDYMVVGSSSDNSGAGSAYIFRKDTNNPSFGPWVKIQTIVSADDTAEADAGFGIDVAIDGDNIIVGSLFPDFFRKGAVYVFEKNSDDIWVKIKKLTPNDPETLDSFGANIAIDGNCIIVGAFGINGTFSDAGAVYIFYKGLNVEGVWEQSNKLIYDDVSNNNYRLGISVDIEENEIVVGASNIQGVGTVGNVHIFNKGLLTSESSNIIILDDTIGGFTGNGYMVANDKYNDIPASDFGVINYPIKAIISDTFDLWIRCLSTNSNVFQAEILIDGNISKTINIVVDDPSDGLEWTWINTTLVLPDSREHILGIKIKENGALIDKLYIDANSDTPYSEGPDNSTSPYLTVHMKVYDSIDDTPGSSLYIYNYKNSITEIVQDDWYNFNIKSLDITYSDASDFVGNYYLVMSSSGSRPDNFVVWELVDNDEYLVNQSAVRF